MILLDDDRASLWWRHQNEELAKKLFDYCEGVEKAQESIFKNNVRHYKLYGNCDTVGVRRAGHDSNGRRTERRSYSPQIDNIIQENVDTVAAIICRAMPRPIFQTDGADWELRARCEDLTQYNDAVFDHSNYYQVAHDVLKDGAIQGTGCAWTYTEGNRVCIERAPIDEIVVDEEECVSSRTPLAVYRRRFVNAFVLADRFPKKRTEIESVLKSEHGYWGGFRQLPSDLIPVIEVYRPPVGNSPGHHVIAIKGHVLFQEDWNTDFPCAFFRWTELPTGFYGQGLAEQLCGIQLELARVNWFITQAQKLVASPIVFVDVASRILNNQLLRNDIARIIPYRGKEPRFLTPQAVGAEIYAYREQLRQLGKHRTGISDFMSHGQGQPGVTAAVAMREVQARDSARLSQQHQKYEDLAVGSAKNVIRMSQFLKVKYSESPSALYARDKDFIRTIKYSAAHIDEHRYRLSVEAGSILSRTPAGRLQEVIELGSNGLMPDQATALRLLAHPDLKAEKSLRTAAQESIDKSIKEVLRGEYVVPDPYQDLDMGIERFTMAYNQALVDQAPDEVLEGLRAWIEQADQLKNQAADAALAEQQMQAQAAAGQPAEGGPQSAFAPTAQNIMPTAIPAS